MKPLFFLELFCLAEVAWIAANCPCDPLLECHLTEVWALIATAAFARGCSYAF